MTTESFAAPPETRAEEERRTSYLELFFDLVFVYAITQVTSLFIDDPTAAGASREPRWCSGSSGGPGAPTHG